MIANPGERRGSNFGAARSLFEKNSEAAGEKPKPNFHRRASGASTPFEIPSRGAASEPQPPVKVDNGGGGAGDWRDRIKKTRRTTEAATASDSPTTTNTTSTSSATESESSSAAPSSPRPRSKATASSVSSPRNGYHDSNSRNDNKHNHNHTSPEKQSDDHPQASNHKPASPRRVRKVAVTPGKKRAVTPGKKRAVTPSKNRAVTPSKNRAVTPSKQRASPTKQRPPKAKLKAEEEEECVPKTDDNPPQAETELESSQKHQGVIQPPNKSSETEEGDNGTMQQKTNPEEREGHLDSTNDAITNSPKTPPPSPPPKKKKLGKKAKAAMKIQAMFRRARQRDKFLFIMDCKRKEKELQKKLVEIKEQTQKELQELDEKVKSYKLEAKRRAKESKEKFKDKMEQCEKNKGEVEKLKKENAQFRTRNEVLKKNCRSLRINNLRLEKSNESQAEYTAQVQGHADRCEKDNKKLLEVEAGYKTKVEELQEGLDTRTAYAVSENRIKRKYRLAVASFFHKVEQSEDNDELLEEFMPLMEKLDPYEEKAHDPMPFEAPSSMNESKLLNVDLGESDSSFWDSPDTKPKKRPASGDTAALQDIAELPISDSEGSSSEGSEEEIMEALASDSEKSEQSYDTAGFDNAYQNKIKQRKAVGSSSKNEKGDQNPKRKKARDQDSDSDDSDDDSDDSSSSGSYDTDGFDTAYRDKIQNSKSPTKAPPPEKAPKNHKAASAAPRPSSPRKRSVGTSAPPPSKASSPAKKKIMKKARPPVPVEDEESSESSDSSSDSDSDSSDEENAKASNKRPPAKSQKVVGRKGPTKVPNKKKAAGVSQMNQKAPQAPNNHNSRAKAAKTAKPVAAKVSQPPIANNSDSDTSSSSSSSDSDDDEGLGSKLSNHMRSTKDPAVMGSTSDSESIDSDQIFGSRSPIRGAQAKGGMLDAARKLSRQQKRASVEHQNQSRRMSAMSAMNESGWSSGESDSESETSSQ